MKNKARNISESKTPGKNKKWQQFDPENFTGDIEKH